LVEEKKIKIGRREEEGSGGGGNDK